MIAEKIWKPKSIDMVIRPEGKSQGQRLENEIISPRLRNILYRMNR
jgi:hypothetical protein